MKRLLIAGLFAFGLMAAVPAMAQVVHERVVVHHPVHHRVIVHRHVRHVRHHYRHPHRTVVVVHH
jgi:hypothetical protein